MTHQGITVKKGPADGPKVETVVMLPARKTILKKIMLTLLGSLFVLIGLIGWLMPVIPGFPLIIIGLPMMLALTPWAEKVEKFLKKLFTVGKNRRSGDSESIDS